MIASDGKAVTTMSAFLHEKTALYRLLDEESPLRVNIFEDIDDWKGKLGEPQWLLETLRMFKSIFSDAHIKETLRTARIQDAAVIAHYKRVLVRACSSNCSTSKSLYFPIWEIYCYIALISYVICIYKFLGRLGIQLAILIGNKVERNYWGIV